MKKRDEGRARRSGDGKPRLLAVGLHIESTGLTRVMSAILGPLAESYEIHHLGIGYRGEPRTEGVHLHPSNLQGGDAFGLYQCRALLESFQPDLVFLLLDLWMLSSYLRFVEGALGKAKVVAYAPLDGTILDPPTLDPSPLDPSPLDALSGLDRLVLYTDFARREVERAASTGGRGGPALAVLPHGVDTSTFRPLPEAERRDLRHRLLGAGAEFVVLNANRPRERKRLDLTIEGFARFAAGKPAGVKLYLHHARTEADERREILALAERHGILDRLLLNPLGTEPAHATDEELNGLYNACDVGLNTSTGEGWGLVSFEHAATGAAQVVPRHSACAELWEGAAELVETVEDVEICGLPMGLRAVSAEKVAAALDRLYREPERRRNLAEAGYRLASRPDFQWSQIAGRWDRLFREVIAGSGSAVAAPFRIPVSWSSADGAESA